MASTRKNAGIVKLGTNLYNIRVRVTCPRTGRRKELERVRECTLTEARALQHDWQKELTASLTVERAPRVRLRDFAASWLTGRKGKIKRTTAQKIADVWDGHVVNTTLADLYVDEIRVEDVEAWIEDMRGKRSVPGKGKATGRKTKSPRSAPRMYSAGTIKGDYRVLSQIITAACACGSHTRALGSSRRSQASVGRTSSPWGVLAHVKVNAPAWHAAVLLDVVSGLRWGELSALRWDDLDESEGVIRVPRGDDKGREVASTKTGDDDDEPKIVPLLAAVADVLRDRRQQMVRDQHPGLAAGWIFPTERGTLHKGYPLRDVLDAACAACKTKRRITPHGLRHTASRSRPRESSGGSSARSSARGSRARPRRPQHAGVRR
jgi:integrase